MVAFLIQWVPVRGIYIICQIACIFQAYAKVSLEGRLLIVWHPLKRTGSQSSSKYILGHTDTDRDRQ